MIARKLRPRKGARDDFSPGSDTAPSLWLATGPIFRPRQARRQLGPGVSASHVELPLGQTRRIGKIEALDTGLKEKSAVKVYRRGERRSSEVRPREIGKRKAAAADIGAMELRSPQFRLCEINIGQIGVLEIRALHFRARKHGALRVQMAEVGPVGLDFVEPGAFGGRVGQGSTHKRCLLKICRKEIAVPEVGRREINTDQVRPAQVLSFQDEKLFVTVLPIDARRRGCVAILSGSGVLPGKYNASR